MKDLNIMRILLEPKPNAPSCSRRSVVVGSGLVNESLALPHLSEVAKRCRKVSKTYMEIRRKGSSSLSKKYEHI